MSYGLALKFGVYDFLFMNSTHVIYDTYHLYPFRNILWVAYIPLGLCMIYICNLSSLYIAVIKFIHKAENSEWLA
jgi:hypothetical protein